MIILTSPQMSLGALKWFSLAKGLGLTWKAASSPIMIDWTPNYWRIWGKYTIILGSWFHLGIGASGEIVSIVLGPLPGLPRMKNSRWNEGRWGKGKKPQYSRIYTWDPLAHLALSHLLSPLNSAVFRYMREIHHQNDPNLPHIPYPHLSYSLKS